MRIPKILAAAVLCVLPALAAAGTCLPGIAVTERYAAGMTGAPDRSTRLSFTAPNGARTLNLCGHPDLGGVVLTAQIDHGAGTGAGMLEAFDAAGGRLAVYDLAVRNPRANYFAISKDPQARHGSEWKAWWPGAPFPTYVFAAPALRSGRDLGLFPNGFRFAALAVEGSGGIGRFHYSERELARTGLQRIPLLAERARHGCGDPLCNLDYGQFFDGTGRGWTVFASTALLPLPLPGGAALLPAGLALLAWRARRPGPPDGRQRRQSP